MNETDFLKSYPEAKRVPQFDSVTVRAFETMRYLWLFDKTDGHLAWKWDRQTQKAIFECDCIKRGKKILFG